jgi:hypothetical protein
VPEPAPVAAPDTKPETVPVLELEPASGIIEATVAQLNSEYNRDNIAVNSKLANKTLKVTGVVDKIFAKENLDIYYILLASAVKQENWKVRCTFDSKNGAQLKRLTVGESVTVQGQYDGYERNIIMKDCALVR